MVSFLVAASSTRISRAAIASVSVSRRVNCARVSANVAVFGGRVEHPNAGSGEDVAGAGEASPGSSNGLGPFEEASGSSRVSDKSEAHGRVVARAWRARSPFPAPEIPAGVGGDGTGAGEADCLGPNTWSHRRMHIADTSPRSATVAVAGGGFEIVVSNLAERTSVHSVDHDIGEGLAMQG